MSRPFRQLKLPNELPMTRYRLDNGLDIYVIRNPSAPVFHIQTWFKVGSRDEKLDPRLGCTGLAHLFEHMMFRGTARHPDGEFDEILTRNGVQDENATTWLDRTNYYQSLPASKLELVLELEADRMANLAIDADLLETEKEAVLGEYRMGLDDPAMVAYEHLYGQAFTVHPYRYTTIGTEAEISGFGVDDANYFYRNYYAPDNATLLLAGDVDPARVEALARKHYGGYTAQSVVRRAAPAEPVQRDERRFEFEHPQLNDPKLLIGYKAPAATHADQAALWVLDAVLTAGQGSRLQRAWVDAGLAVGVGGCLDQFRDPGLWVASADLRPGRDPSEAIAALDATIAELLDPSPSRAAAWEAEVERARNQLLLGLYQAWLDNDGLCNFMGECLSSADDPLFAFEQVARVERVEAREVLRVAREYLVPSRRTIVVGKEQSS